MNKLTGFGLLTGALASAMFLAIIFSKDWHTIIFNQVNENGWEVPPAIMYSLMLMIVIVCLFMLGLFIYCSGKAFEGEMMVDGA